MTTYKCPNCNTLNEVDVKFYPNNESTYNSKKANPPQPPKGIFGGLFWDSMHAEITWMYECESLHWTHQITCPICNHRQRFWKPLPNTAIQVSEVKPDG